MPLYNLRCRCCDFTKEVLCNMKDVALETCDKCKASMYILPSRSNFKVNGFSASNNYSGINHNE